MALNFPNSPTANQIYTDSTTGNRYLWDATNKVWRWTPNTISLVVQSLAPGSPSPGQLWWNADLGRMFVYYNDGDSSQWVETNPVPDVYAITNSAIQSYAVSANNWANTKLANTTGTFAGTLTATGNVAASFFLGNGSLLSAIPAYNNTSIQVFTTGTGASYTAPSGLKSALVIVTGGGGGGGGSDAADTTAAGGGGGGGAGGTAIKLFTAAEMTGATYTVGAAGGAGSGTNGTDGSSGGNTSFTPSSGNILFGYGGDFGSGSGAQNVGNAVTGGDGGSGANGTMIIDGGDGNFGVGDDVGEMGIGGMGGSSFWGGGGWGGAAQGAFSNPGGAGLAYGSGGGGGGTVDVQTGSNGGVGKAGVIFVLEFCS